MNEQQAKRLSDCEILISKYQDQVNKLKSDILRDNEKLIVDEIEKRWKIYIENILGEVQEIKNKLIDFDAKFQHQILLIEGMKENHIQLKADLSMLKSKYDIANQKSDDLEQKIKEQEDKNIVFNQKHQEHDLLNKRFVEQSGEIAKSDEEYKKFVDKHQENIKKINDNFVDLKNFMVFANQSFGEIRLSLEKDREDFKRFVDKLSLNMENISSNLNSQLNVASSSLHDRINKLNIPKETPLDEIKGWINESKKEAIDFSNKNLIDLGEVKEQSRINQILMMVVEKKLEKILSILANNNMRI